MNLKKHLAVTALAVAGLMSGSAQAMLLDFNADPSAQGSADISWDGSASSGVVGTNIGVTELYSAQTPVNQGETYDIIGGTLNFETGGLIGTDSYTDPFGNTTDYWYFGGGGYIELTGTVDLDRSGDVSSGDVDGTLFSGEFDSAVVQSRDGGLGYELILSYFSSTINTDLLGFFGIDPYDANGNPIIWLGQFYMGFDIDWNPNNGGFTSNRVNGGYIKQMPAPATLMLLGAGLLGLGATKRLGKRKAA